MKAIVHELRWTLGILCLALSVSSPAQMAPQPGPTDVQKALALAQKGQCRVALPTLRRGAARVADKQLKYNLAMAQARCAMSLGDTAATIDSLLMLQRNFPDDPEVLYISTHYFSQMANQAAQRLVKSAPTSAQLQKLNAEALESQGKWDDAIAAYRKILEQYPKEPQVHYRIARILLDQSSAPESTENAKAELQQELAVNPESSAAEFILGEIARRAADWNTAVKHFQRAAELDASFSEAYLASGMSLASAGKFAEAIPPLEKYVKMQPEDPAGHYQLAIAYSRTGNRSAAEREMELRKSAGQNAPLKRAPAAQAPQ